MPPLTTPMVRQVLRLAQRPGGEFTPDRELAARFAGANDEGAFAELVDRHGAMVMGVCRRLLRDPHAAEDAFQATFLVFAQKAGCVRWRDSVGGWLFEVARRVSRRAAASAARRRSREGPLDPGMAEWTDHPGPGAVPSDTHALRAVLDEELARLPDRIRAPLVLSYLEGRAGDDVATQLGLSDGQLRGRLHRGKQRLRERLRRRGVTLEFALAACVVGPSVGAAAPGLAFRLTAAAVSVRSSGRYVAASDPVHSLTREVLRDMVTPYKFIAAVALFGAIGIGAVGRGPSAVSADPPKAVAPADAPPPGGGSTEAKNVPEAERVRGRVRSVDVAKGSLVVAVEEDDKEADYTFTLEPAAAVRYAAKAFPLADAKPGMRADLTVLRKSGTAATAVDLRWASSHAEVKAMDPAKGTATVSIEGKDGEQFELTFGLPADAAVTVDGLPSGADDVTGLSAELDWSADKKSILAVHGKAPKDEFYGTVKAADPADGSVTVVLTVAARRDERKVELTFPLAADAKIRHAGRDVKASGLKEGMPVRLRLGKDRRTVAALWAADPQPETDEKNDD